MRKIYLFLTLAILSLSASAQIAVTVTGRLNASPTLAPTYTSLALALGDLNAVSNMTGPVTFTCTAGGTEVAPASGLTIGNLALNGQLSATNTFTLTVAGGGTATLKAAVGTVTPSSATLDGVLKIVGADYVTINGLTFTDDNTTNPASMEYGIGLFKRTAADGARNNTIQNCIINLPRVNNAPGGAPMFDGSVGILMVNATPSAATTVLTPSSAAGTNSGNRFYGNTVNGGTTGIGLSGYAATTGYPLPSLGDVNNDVGGPGGSLATTGNTVLNYGGGTGGNPAAGIRANNQWGLNISNNTVNNNNGFGVNHNTTLRGIYTQAGTSANVTISYNTVTVKSVATTSALHAIENGIGSTAASNTINISNNTIRDCAYPTATGTGELRGIYNTATAATVNIVSNQVIDNSVGNAGTNSSCVFTGIWPTGAPTAVNISNNTVAGNEINNNYGVMYCLRGGSANTTVSGNNVFNNAIPNGTGANNSELYGIYNSSSPTQENYSNNNIYNLSITGNNTANDNVICGIYKTDDNSNSITVSGNNVNGLSFSGSGAGSALVAGIRIDRGTTAGVSKNVIHALSSTGPSPSVAGIYTGASAITTLNAVNNVIGNLETPTSTGHNLFGIYTSSGGTNLNFYYNTVFLNATSTGSGFASSSVFMSSNAPTVTLRNNLLVNLSTATGAGLTAAIRRASNSLSGYGSASNNNLVYAGTPSAARVLYADVNSSDQTLAAFKTRVAPRESASVTETVSVTPGAYFQSLTGPAMGSDASFLHIVNGLNTAAESSGANIAGFADDYDGQLRAGNAGYPGTGSAPDIGADEFDGTLSGSACAPVSVPYFEGFESITAPNTLPACVLASPAPVAGGKTQTFTAAAKATNPALEPRNGSRFAAVYYQPIGAGYFISAPLQLTGGTTYTASVWYKTNGVAWTEAGLYYGTSPNATALTNRIDTVLNAAATVYTEINGTFTPAATGVYYVAVRAFNANSNPEYIAFDDLSVAVAPSCAAPVATAATAVAYNRATLNWNAPQQAPASYEIYYSADNTPPTSATAPTVSGITGLSRVVTGLTASTTYYAWVRSNCGANGVSDWSATGINFTTLCAPVTPPYAENFDGAVLPNLPACTSREDANNDGNTWLTVAAPAGYTGKTLQYVGNSGAANDWFYTAGMNLTAGTTYTLVFRYGNSSSIRTERMKVAYGGAPTADSMKSALADYPNIGGSTATAANVSFTPALSGVYYIGFQAYSLPNQSNLYLDDISVNAAAVCGTPTGLSVTGVSGTSANASWTGTGTFILEYGPAGFAPGTGTAPGTNGKVVNPATSPQAITGLTPGVLYDVYVRQNCTVSNNGFSANGAKVSFATLPLNDDPAGATVLTQTAYNAACSTALYTTVGGTASPIISACFSGGANDDDVWFAFTATNSKAILKVSNYTSASGTVGAFQYGLYTGPVGLLTELDCETLGSVTTVNGGGEIALKQILTPGQTYYVRVLTNGTGGRASFNLCVMTPDVALTTANTCVAAVPVTINAASGNNGLWVPFYTADGKLVAEINAKGNNLGAVTVKVYRNTAAVRTDNAGKAYLDRNFEIVPAVQPSGPVSVRLYFTVAEFTLLNNKPGSQVGSAIGNLSVFKNSQACSGAITGAAYPVSTTSSGYEANYYSAFDVTAFSSFFFASNAYSVLPANLLSFSGLRQGANNVLKWTVAQERDVQAYEVERSADGRNWTMAGTVNGLGNTAAQRSYGFTDNNVAGLKQYYRLRQLDVNGAVRLSNVVVITGAKPAVLVLGGLFPNPASARLNVLVEAPAKQSVTLMVMDAAGRVVQTKKVTAEAGANTFDLNVTALSQGVYWVKLKGENGEPAAVGIFVKE